MASLRPCEMLHETRVDAISSPVEAESKVRCKVYNFADFSSPMRHSVVMVATISEMMNCDEWMNWRSQLIIRRYEPQILG